eukprot:scaffold4556_cov114-Isochrysis_galbana.AAC.6
MERGTPTSSMARFGSPVMTVRAEKSTRLPIRLPRTRPSLPSRRCEMDLSGRPQWVVAGSTPGSEFVTKVARWYCGRRGEEEGDGDGGGERVTAAETRGRGRRAGDRWARWREEQGRGRLLPRATACSPPHLA